MQCKYNALGVIICTTCVYYEAQTTHARVLVTNEPSCISSSSASDRWTAEITWVGRGGSGSGRRDSLPIMSRRTSSSVVVSPSWIASWCVASGRRSPCGRGWSACRPSRSGVVAGSGSESRAGASSARRSASELAAEGWRSRHAFPLSITAHHTCLSSVYLQ